MSNPIVVALAACTSIAVAPLGASAQETPARSGANLNAVPAPTPADTPADTPNVEHVNPEDRFFRNAVQLTFPDRFLRAGESYFSPDANWIVFQGIERPQAIEGQPAPEPERFYAMYVARLVRNDAGTITGLDTITRISPKGSANTCGWFSQDGLKVIYGSTIGPPTNESPSGFQVRTRQYVWQFPKEMEIVEQQIFDAANPGRVIADAPLTPIFTRNAYDAECSLTRDGRFVLHTQIREGSEPADGDLYIYDRATSTQIPIVTADGYDGGPFFSPDERWICYRSDRKGDNLLQLYVAELTTERLPDGGTAPVGIKREHPITSNQFVNWAPFWHPSQTFLVYSSSQAGGSGAEAHSNYETYAIPLNLNLIRMGQDATAIQPIRITHAPGADLLPAFSPDGSLMIWTSQRGGGSEGGGRPSSQLWIAEWIGDATINAAATSK